MRFKSGIIIAFILMIALTVVSFVFLQQQQHVAPPRSTGETTAEPLKVEQQTAEANDTESPPAPQFVAIYNYEVESVIYEIRSKEFSTEALADDYLYNAQIIVRYYKDDPQKAVIVEK